MATPWQITMITAIAAKVLGSDAEMRRGLSVDMKIAISRLVGLQTKPGDMSIRGLK